MNSYMTVENRTAHVILQISGASVNEHRGEMSLLTSELEQVML